MPAKTFALLAIPLLAGSLLLPAAQAGTLIELSAEASRPAANDLLRAVVYAEANAADPAELAKRVNQEIAEALRLIKGKAGISVKSGNQHTYPVYGNNRKIESWRMRSELVLESKDGAALSELLAKLQQMKLALGNVSQLPSPATRRLVEEGVTQDAIRAFEARAALVAGTLGKPYKIKRLNIQQSSQVPPMPMLRAAKMEMASDAAPVPLEAGESQISSSISGEIELAD
ncbi:cyclic nucleotide-binding protein [Dechloromonas denitrificans]|uniref:Cyclic nucleotide-binding protein n=1 Tax=Dechloromonas denitrificans TaxID=281362 RepID=A0A133XDK1_9RHOO|nr:SIMPL domain-containing protein [Dechloromonas denitrificans]KXB29012.1 cyclic nucleotide-binding protein [Dechloromonas denitrificans]